MADLPIAGIVCLAVGGYVLVIVGIAVCCYFLKGRGKCGESQCCAKEEGTQSCECCMAVSEACNCCKSPSVTSCLDICCPNRKRITCVDIVMCQCCSSDGKTLCDNPESTSEWNKNRNKNAMTLEIKRKQPTRYFTSSMHNKYEISRSDTFDNSELTADASQSACCGGRRTGFGRLCKKLRCCQRNREDTCNCLCLEIRMRSPQDRHVSDLKFPAPAGPGSGTKTKDAWMAPSSPVFRAIPYLPSGEDGYHEFHEGVWERGGRRGGHGWGNLPSDLQLDLGYFRSAPYPISTHPINTNRSENSGDFVPTSTPRFHHGQSQLFIRPGVHSAGRVMAKRQSGPWLPQSWTAPAAIPSGSGRRRSHWKRRSSSLKRRMSLTHHRSRSPGRHRSSGHNHTLVRPLSRRQSHKEPQSQWAAEDLQ